MSLMDSATGYQRRTFVPRPAESVPPAVPQDPPIYRDLLRSWADRGRALPGRHDPEWTRLAAPTVLRGQFSDPRVPPRDVR
ncbi:hypothetical protein D9753_29740 [Streptomyces dangxiongensis]|uniref:Uncharacterized protein n=1 Tax=Streptomyces dangxiongensis TaxID=1442032 RepID=A0A3G2JLT8_9ACTN|nr:hypothetical protein D9753_29740 [Streptomyces dangxiongensis]